MSSSGPGAFAERLRRHREAAALSQEELAARAGLTAKAIGALERGERRRPYPHTVRALADALGLSDADRAALAAAVQGTTPQVDKATNRPVPLSPTRLVGRDAERRSVLDLLTTGTRLVTLTGPGGVGKTSLALDVAHAVAHAVARPVTVVELAALRDAGQLLPAVARALDARLPGPPADAVAAALGAAEHLLVLDNLEHLLGAAPDVAELLARCPGLTVLATSRAALRIRAEHELPLSPLAVPTSGRDVATSPAAQVFLDRARAAGRAVVLTEETAHDVAAICRRLDGLPLALELAAAHARFLAPHQLLQRLDSALAVPRSRDLPERQRTVAATLDWSCALLTRDEQALFGRLSVFAGGFDLDAVEAIGGDLATLGGLVEQSLVVPTGDRFRMLEPVRQYAAAKMAMNADDDAADRAAGFFADLAAGARAGLRGPEQAAWLDRLAREHDNLSATLQRLVERRRVGDAAELAAATWLYWALRGNTAGVLTWLERTRGAVEPGELPVHGKAALEMATAGLRCASGDMAGMRAPASAAVEAAQEAGDDDLLAEALTFSGIAAVFLGHTTEADGLLEQARAVSRSAGLPWTHAHAVIADGQRLIGIGDLTGAAARIDEGERLARALGNPFTLVTALNVRGSLTQLTGDDDAALAAYTEAVDISARLEARWTMTYTLAGLAAIAALRGHPELAAELFAVGSATAEAGSVAVAYPPDLEVVRRWLPVVRGQLGEDAFHRAWERGRGLRLTDMPSLAARINGRSAPA